MSGKRLRGVKREVLHSEKGFGMIEIVVSLFLLTLLTMSFIPLIITTQKSAGANTTIATATQIVNQQLEGARSVRSPGANSPSCQDVTRFLQTTQSPVTDPRGVTLQPQWDPTACPTVYPGVIKVGVSVARTGSSASLASAVTLVYVASAT